VSTQPLGHIVCVHGAAPPVAATVPPVAVVVPPAAVVVPPLDGDVVGAPPVAEPGTPPDPPTWITELGGAGRLVLVEQPYSQAIARKTKAVPKAPNKGTCRIACKLLLILG